MKTPPPGDTDKGNEETPDPPPAAPTGLAADATSTSCTLAWDTAEDADEYAVMQDDELVNQGPDNGYTAEGLEPETTYTFSVTALNSDGESDPATVECTTAPVDVITDPPTTDAPLG
ncbi:fibronectin type III domain-containing protein [Streptomyces justiciae]|uniref:Fibronectin type III domain-containing protein n=1 Tax=Streptomyces justiciae TaxID=2780140 RepID=A0ABU3LLF7_9ACTN|nr:fibronectin type III domain-containing protein [Streptomyces justiciae]MDT7840069.1 fibronectin type III domain-containing protein [Streptomyces justiciae]